VKEIANILVMIFILSGSLLTLLSAIGVIRLPDVYTRSHAIGKSTTLGIMSILLGTFLYFFINDNHFEAPLLLSIAFVFMTSPVASHLISRAAYYSRVELWEKTVRDDLKHKRNEG
jgi:multicomponent Na+:H+ antiporter subunit G